MADPFRTTKKMVAVLFRPGGRNKPQADITIFPPNIYSKTLDK